MVRPELKEQAKGPLFNLVEMAMADESTVVARLRIDEKYLRQFAEAFPAQTDPLKYDNLAGSIAAFERTLVTRDRFDDYLKGDDGALNPAEVKGLKTFLSVGCTTCHNGPLLGANSYRRVGIVKPCANQTDLGRGAIVKSDEDVDWNFQFKVPSLRNIAATAPYFHDGKIATLPEAVRTMASIQLDLELSNEQEQDLVAFLGCLTGKGIIPASSASAQPASATEKERVSSTAKTNLK
jgi:cytochrome c peroxidase